MTTDIVYKITDSDIIKAANIIREGGLVVFPTETVYGLGANALDPTAADKIYKAKGRPSDNPLIIHLAKASDAQKYCVTNEDFYKLAEAFMPGPLTVILPKKEIVPSNVTGGLDTVALRVPCNEVANALISAAGVPVAAPSANISGRPSPTAPDHVVEDMQGRVDMILCAGECDIGVESTIITLVTEVPTILRPGKITLSDIRRVLPEAVLADAVLNKFEGKPLSPGMKYKHYAPRAEVVLLDGEYSKIKAFLSSQRESGILCYDEDKELLSLPYALSVGAKDKPDEEAHLLFARLREFDSMPQVKKIYAPMPDREGIGLAVLNRLIRAAGFTVIEID